jgi:hypothetical protein
MKPHSDSDEDCDSDLICFQREGDDPTLVPGCIGKLQNTLAVFLFCVQYILIVLNHPRSIEQAHQHPIMIIASIRTITRPKSIAIHSA